jgi:hypothetical protein
MNSFFTKADGQCCHNLVLSPSSPDDLVAAEALATSCLLTAGTPGSINSNRDWQIGNIICSSRSVMFDYLRFCSKDLLMLQRSKHHTIPCVNSLDFEMLDLVLKSGIRWT